jgi:hypothetical protein
MALNDNILAGDSTELKLFEDFVNKDLVPTYQKTQRTSVARANHLIFRHTRVVL